MDSLFKEVEISWDSSLLGGRSAPQAVKITTPDFFTKFYPRLNDWDWKSYLQNKDEFYERIPRPLHGVMDYKTPIDYMQVYFYRPGMEACVSKNVKNLFKSLNVNESQYRMIPIELGQVPEEYYVLFYPFTGLFEEAGVIWSQCIFVDRYNYEEVHFTGKDDFLTNLHHCQKAVKAKRIVLPIKYSSFDVINLWHSGRCFLSERITSSLSKIRGTEIVTSKRTDFCELLFE